MHTATQPEIRVLNIPPFPQSLRLRPHPLAFFEHLSGRSVSSGVIQAMHPTTGLIGLGDAIPVLKITGQGAKKPRFRGPRGMD